LQKEKKKTVEKGKLQNSLAYVINDVMIKKIRISSNNGIENMKRRIVDFWFL